MAKEIIEQSNREIASPSDDIQASRIGRIVMEGAIIIPSLAAGAIYAPSPIKQALIAGIIVTTIDMAKTMFDYSREDRSVIRAERENKVESRQII